MCCKFQGLVKNKNKQQNKTKNVRLKVLKKILNPPRKITKCGIKANRENNTFRYLYYRWCTSGNSDSDGPHNRHILPCGDSAFPAGEGQDYNTTIEAREDDHPMGRIPVFAEGIFYYLPSSTSLLFPQDGAVVEKSSSLDCHSWGHAHLKACGAGFNLLYQTIVHDGYTC